MFGLVLLYNLTVLHANFAVGKVGKLLVMGDDDKGLPHLVPQIKEKSMQFFLIMAVERTAWLVGKDYIGLVDEGSCYGNALLLSSGKFVRLVRGAV